VKSATSRRSKRWRTFTTLQSEQRQICLQLWSASVAKSQHPEKLPEDEGTLVLVFHRRHCLIQLYLGGLKEISLVKVTTDIGIKRERRKVRFTTTIATGALKKFLADFTFHSRLAVAKINSRVICRKHFQKSATASNFAF